jgi:hypothetical protein
MPTIHIPDVGDVELPNYAMQHTLENLVQIMGSERSEQSEDFSKMEAAIARTTGVTREEVAESKRQTPALTSIAYSSKQTVQDTQMTLRQMKKQIREAEKQSNFMKQLPQVMRGAGSMLTGGGIGDLAALMPGNFAAGLNLATKVLTKFADTQRSLTDVGMGLGTSILDTTQALASVNMPIFEFERVAGQYSTALDHLNDSTIEFDGEFGDLVKKGVNKGGLAFGMLSDKVRTSMDEFGNMGLTVTEINTFLGEYLESDRKRHVGAQQSFEGLTRNFTGLMKETAAYAVDTGRNRKEMIKAQIETLSREDASGYAMRMRMKGDDDAAKNFEDNLGLVSNEMFARFGKAGDAVKEMMLQAVMSGRGLEATEEGANLAAMYGEAGGVLHDMIRQFKTGKLDPKLFDKLSVALKNGTIAIDQDNYANIRATNASLGIVEKMQITEKYTTEHGRLAAKERLKVGSDIVKGDEMLTKATAALQQSFAKLSNKLIGEDGTFGPVLDLAIDGLQRFVDTLGIFAGGDFTGGIKALKDLVVENPMAQLFTLLGVGSVAAKIGAGVATGRGVLGGGLSTDQRGRLATDIAGKNIKGHTDVSFDERANKIRGLTYGGKEIAEGGTFKHEGVEYKVKNGKPVVTPAGVKALGGGGKFGRGVKGGAGAGMMTAALVAYDTYQEYSGVKEQYDALIKGADTDGKKEKLQKEKETRLKSIIGKGFASGGGSVLGGMLGAGTLSTVLGPLGTLIGGITGSIGGSYGGEAAWEMFGKDIIAMMEGEDIKEGDRQGWKLENEEEIKEKKRKEAEEESPIYQSMQQIITLLSDWLGSTKNIEETSRIAAIVSVENHRDKSTLGTSFDRTYRTKTIGVG